MKIYQIILLMFVFGCSDMNFVYNTDTNIKELALNNNTILEVSGNEQSAVKVFLKKQIGETNQNAKYKLLLNLIKTEKNLVVNDNQTASRIEIIIKINYKLYDLKNKNCLIIEKEVILSGDYIVKSEGYSFGTEESKRKTIKKLIENNISTFLNDKKLKENNPKC